MIKFLPLMLSVGIGLCINQTRAVWEALSGKQTEFVRTPKHGVDSKKSSWRDKRYRAMKTFMPCFEIFMGLYFCFALLVAYQGQHYISMPFLLLFLIGFSYVGVLSVYQRR